ncbi:FAD-binding oxidoreductase [Halomarina litorea]|uniref:FAD-binding oxidoreductase n=1 Tax=Halomarina litorea TaxID=2961595 RepID=UPI0020C2F20A|nr:FAD-binding oxidoreductase [Halomarina sp. BCD28]
MAVEFRIVDDEAIQAFEEGFRGSILRPGDDAYDEARSIWNAMIDRRPALVARCAGVADVIRSVNFAREHGLPLAVHGGGHNIAGNAVCDDGLMLDLSPMRSVRVDPEARIAWAEPGVTLAEFDHETQAFGLATPLGINSTTGLAGLTLGGGFGWLSRSLGLTIDNLRAVELVTARGELVHASEDEHPDLFWGVRGGSGNFGVVTGFEFDLHDIGTAVLSGLVVHPFDDPAALLRQYRDFVAEAPEELSAWVVLRHAPPLPFLPESVHGDLVVVFAACYVGDAVEGERVLAPLRELGDPIADVISPHQYTAWQQAFDPLLTEGARNYWKSHYFAALSDDAIDTFVEHARTIPSPLTEIFIGHLGGAINRIPSDATAYPHRDAEFTMNVHGRWESPERDDEVVAWARALHEALTPYATGGVYGNFVPEREGQEHAVYGENYDRLVELKDEWDPENLFSMNQNVAPSARPGDARPAR